MHTQVLPSVPFFPVLPIMNVRQQIAALMIQAEESRFADVISLFDFFQSNQLFERLPGVSVVLQVRDLRNIPANFAERFSCARIVLLIPEAVWQDAQQKQALKQLQDWGVQTVCRLSADCKYFLLTGIRSVAVNLGAGMHPLLKSFLSTLNAGWHLAENVATQTQLCSARDAGFAFFLGEYAHQPVRNGQSADRATRPRLLKLLGLVTRDADSRELEELFRQDPGLSFQLFKLVSSAAFAQTVKVTNLNQAISLLGRRQLQRWLQLLLYARQDDTSGSLNPLMARAAFRAALTENLCRAKGGNRDELDSAFMVGMFSLLGVLFDMPLEQIVQPLNLSTEVAEALLFRKGMLGACLATAERSDVPAEASLLDTLEMNIEDHYRGLIQAYEWVIKVCQDI